MDEMTDEFYVSLPSNASIQYFPQNNQSSYRTKLASPLLLNDSWEVGLTEIFIPRNWYNVGEYNNDYVITRNVEKGIPIKFSRHTLSFNYGVLVSVGADVSLEAFLLKLNESIKKMLGREEAVKFLHENQGRTVHLVLANGFEVHISKRKAPKMLQMFHLPDEDIIINKSQRLRFKPLAENKDQLFSIINRTPSSVKLRLIPLTLIKNGISRGVFADIAQNISDLKMDNYITFTYNETKPELEIKVSENTELHITQERASSLLRILGANENLIISQTQKFAVVLPLTVEAGEAMEFVIKGYPEVTTTEKETLDLHVSTGVYKSPESLFREFQYVRLRQLANSKVFLEVPPESELTLGRGLADMLGFVNNHFKSGKYTSDYPLELDGGITEIFVYSDLIESHHVGDVHAPLLRIIPCVNERNDQIVKHYEKTIYFPLRKHYVDTIEIELRTSSGKKITFTGGKTFVMLSFRRKKTI